MAKSISAPAPSGIAARTKAARGLVADTTALANKLPEMSEAKINQSLGEVSQTGVDMTANPLAKSMTMRKEAANVAASTKADTAAKGLELRGQAIKMAGEADNAKTDAYNKAYAAIAAEKERLGGVGGWMTGSQRRQFEQFKTQQMAGLGAGMSTPNIRA